MKQRGKDFDAALKAKARHTGWRFARGEIFRQKGDWFINVMPSLLWERGAIVRMMVKPMALDPLFWDVVGLSGNEALPLSFRASGAWVLRPPSIDEPIALVASEVELLAAEILDWSNRRAQTVLQNTSLRSMLAELPDEQELRGQHRALAICLNIMMNDLDAANILCEVNDPTPHPLMRDAGGFTTHNSDGSISTFLEQARDWIARKRLNELRAV
ncbi:hypothetical protein [Hephaestia mangrovi]|uniref:hypothetical protein n=1 Tax=Hephaestia mangrovi TaxID=2873268 RepID=UPI001CA726D4|nr:hypothetical protein [Hephaestia mangrovi]MBY8829795.1 hypothetical protein [Hephaestia mangrovi]